MPVNATGRPHDGTQTLAGSSVQILADNGNRQFLIIQNNSASNMGINVIGGTAVINGTGTLTLTPGAMLFFDSYVPLGAISAIGTGVVSVMEG